MKKKKLRYVRFKYLQTSIVYDFMRSIHKLDCISASVVEISLVQNYILQCTIYIQACGRYMIQESTIQNDAHCPSDLKRDWQYYAGGSWVTSETGTARCRADCDKFPQYEECGRFLYLLANQIPNKNRRILFVWQTKETINYTFHTLRNDNNCFSYLL